jgi:transposase
LTELLDLQGYFVEGIKNGKEITLYLERGGNPICPNCNKEHTGRIKDKREQIVEDVFAFGKRVYLVFTKERINCECGYRGYEKIEWLSKYSRITNRLGKWLYAFCKVMTVMDVARIFGFAKETIFRIDKEGIKKELETQPPIKTKRVSMDEISKEKGKVYATVISDPVSKKILDVLESRKKAVITQFYERKGKKWCNKILVATMDAWVAFRTATEEKCKNAKICYDHFHLAQHFSKAIDKIRISEIKRVGKKNSDYLKGTRWLLLKRPENLKETEKESLNKLLKINRRLFKVYILRSEFRQIFEGHSSLSRLIRFTLWIKKAKAAKIKGLTQFVDKIIRWKPYIENALRENTSNAYSEGVNTKIRVIQRKAYGYKDFDYLRLKIIQQFNFPQVKCLFD